MFGVCIACSMTEKITKDRKSAHSCLLGHSTVVMVNNISQYGQSGGRKFGGRHRLTGHAKGAPLGENSHGLL